MRKIAKENYFELAVFLSSAAEHEAMESEC